MIISCKYPLREEKISVLGPVTGRTELNGQADGRRGRLTGVVSVVSFVSKQEGQRVLSQAAHLLTSHILGLVNWMK